MSTEMILKAVDQIEGRMNRDQATVIELADRVLQLEQKGVIRPFEGAADGAGLSAEVVNAPLMLKSAADMRKHFREPGAPTVGIGEFLRGVAGMRTSELATKALSVGTDASGGFAVPRNTAGQILEALVPASSLLLAGCPVIPIGAAKTTTTAIVNAIPTAAWRLENGAVAESEPTFRSVVATPQSLSFRFKISRELLADGNNIEGALQNVIAQALAKELDRAGLRGSGTAPEPRGILNTAGVQSVTNGANGAALAGYANFFSGVQAILQADAPMPKAAIMSPRSLVKLGGLLDTTNQPLQVPRMLDRMQMGSTSQVPNNLTVGTSTDCSEIYIGDFSQMAIILREGVTIQLLNELYAEAGQVGFVGHVRADVSVFYPAAFAVVTGVR